MKSLVAAFACIALLLTAACASAPQKAREMEAARLNTRMGVDYAQKGQYPSALQRLQRALSQDEQYVDAHVAIAFVYQAQGDTKKAERHYRRALALNSTDPSLKNNFGTFLCSVGKIEEGERYLLDAVKDPRYPTPAVAWTNAGLCVKKSDEAKAEQYFREALRIDVGSREALAQMALLSHRHQDYLRTRAFLQRYDLQKSATAELLYVAARTERALGDAAAAAALEARLLKEFPLSTEAATARSPAR
jgi:type IV pilus assembly protein PilF